MHRPLQFCLLTCASYFAATTIAWAGTITPQGAITALDDVSQLQGTLGVADFSDPIAVYAAAGMTYKSGPLTTILPGSTTAGSATLPSYQANGNYFPAPIAGGAVASGTFAFHAGVVTFADPVTQLGLTASANGTQYLTVWDLNGNMLGQVTWQPSGDAAFVGIDTNGVPIGMAAYGNHDLWAGDAYSINGSTIISDTWIWALGLPCQSDDECVDDQNPCTAAPTCVAGACIHAPDDNGICPDDGESCTFDECQNGSCVHPANNQGECLDDGNGCTDDYCSAGACTHPNNTDPCDDGDMCSENDVCGNGMCNGDNVSCGDMNVCTQDSCESDVGCVFDWTPNCCIADTDCDPGYICLFGSNSCIVDPDPTGDGDGDPTTGDGDGDPTTGDGDGDPTTGDGDGDPTTGDGDPTTGDGDGDPTAGESGTDGGTEIGETGEPFDTFGGDVTDEGCSCSTDERGAGALFGLFGLALFGAVRRRRDDL